MKRSVMPMSCSLPTSSCAISLQGSWSCLRICMSSPLASRRFSYSERDDNAAPLPLARDLAASPVIRWEDSQVGRLHELRSHARLNALEALAIRIARTRRGRLDDLVEGHAENHTSAKPH